MMKKIMSAVLSAAMLISMVNVSIYAKEDAEEYVQSVEQTEITETAAVDYAADGLPEYRASEYFAADASKVTNGVWTSQYYDSTKNVYTNYNYKASKVLEDNMHDFPEGYVDDDKYNGLAVRGAGTGIVTKFWMRGPGANNGGTNCSRYFTTRTFSAPETGTVSIYAVDADGSLGVHGSLYTAGTAKSKIKIMKNSEQIWPADNGVQEVEPGKGNNLTLSPQSVSVNKGDKLCFMLDTSACRDTSLGGGTWDDIKRTAVYWDPVVAYTGIGADADIYVPEKTVNVAPDEIFTIPSRYTAENLTAENVKIIGCGNVSVNTFEQNEDGDISLSFNNLESLEPYAVEIKDNDGKTLCRFSFTVRKIMNFNSYRSSDYFVSESKVNPNDVWSWQYYDVEKKTYGNYNTIKTIDIDSDIYPVLDEANRENVFFAVNGGGFQGNVGKYWCVAPGTLEHDDKYYGARTFTAPVSGNVKVSCIDYEGNKAIRGNNRDYITDFGTRAIIYKENSSGENIRVWPSEEDGKKIKAKAKVDFDDFEVYLNQGDKLHFVMNWSGISNWEQQKNAGIYWDPIVSYNAYCDISEYTPYNAHNLGINQIFTLRIDNLLNDITKDDITITGSDGAKTGNFRFSGKTAEFDFDGLKYGTEYEVCVNNLEIADSYPEVITYKFKFTTMQLEFEAAKYFGETSGQNPKTPWAWEYYDTASGSYNLMKYYTDKTTLLSTNADLYPFAKGELANYASYSSVSGTSGGAINKYWVIAPTDLKELTAKYMVKTFTAFESGDVEIYCSDYDQNSCIRGLTWLASRSQYGPEVRIIKEDASGNEVQIWPKNGETVNIRPNSVIEFEPLNINISKGEKLHFVTDASGAAADETKYAMNNSVIYWNPIVKYNELHSTLTGMSPENGAENVPVDTEFVLSYNTDICEVKKDDVEIDGAEVSSVETIGSELHIKFSGLKEKKRYTAAVKNVRPYNLPEKNNYRYEFTFTTGMYTYCGKFVVNGGANTVKDGRNTVSIDASNTAGDGYSSDVTVIAAFCSGSDEKYDIEKTFVKTIRGITGRKTIELDFDIEKAEGKFLKLVAVNNPIFGAALTDIYTVSAQ